MRAPKAKKIGSWLWHGLNAVSLTQWLWSLGGGAVFSAIFSAFIHLSPPWSFVLGAGVFLLSAAAILSQFNRRRTEPTGEDSRQATGKSWTGQPPANVTPPNVARSAAASEKRASKSTGEGGELSRLLQRRLDQGVSLRKNIPAMPGMVSPTRPTTTQADVETWARRTKALLEPTPKLLAEFNYKPPRALLDGLLATNPLEPAYKKTLDQQIANLGEIIIQLREQGR
ncbi:MAG TPA: hypothetical protein VG898_08525 [Solirubrobacterales bacterium]|nr:hypothetical protein [Solirubrobacterales bacterium]